MSEITQLEETIAALEAQRGILGDAIVDASVNALREKLVALKARSDASSHGSTQQRKLVTVLFADISGFTALAENLDPEDTTLLINALWERLDGVIRANGGWIDKHIGDAVMALWGADTGREDDPERAIRAALRMQANAADFSPNQVLSAQGGASLPHLPPLALRIGISSGPVLLGEVGTTQEFTAMGDPVNLASRLEQACPLNGVLIAYDTYRHVRGLFDVQSRPPLAVKGKAEPVQTYLVEAVRPRAFRLYTRGVEGVETRMVGRQAELQRLQNALHTVARENRLQALTLVGEAGMGKSRLLYEFLTWFDVQPASFWLFKGRSSESMQHAPFSLLRSLFAFRFEILDGDSPPEARRKLEEGITAFVLAGASNCAGQDAAAAQEMAHFIGHLIGLDFSTSPYLQPILDDPRQVYDRALYHLGQFFAVLTASGPALLLLEDIHWGDDSSLDAIMRLVRQAARQPLFVLALARPTLYERCASWGEGLEGHARLDIQPLSQEASRQLAAEILQKMSVVPEALSKLLVEKSGGNPFYIEELVKVLVDEGVILRSAEPWQVDMQRLDALHVPPTLSGILQARLDGLTAAERTALQRASVMGMTFWDDAVRAMQAEQDEAILPLHQDLNQTLLALRQRELVYRRDLSAFSGVDEYFFKHVMLRDVTYETVLKRLRRVYHLQAANWLEAHSAGRLEEYAGLIAGHYEMAGDLHKACDYLRRAGQSAALLFAHSEAAGYFTRLLALLPAEALQERWQALLGREIALDQMGLARQRQAQDVQALASLADELGSVPCQAQAALRRANYAYVTSDYSAAVAAAQSALELAQAAQSSDEDGISALSAALQAEAHRYWGDTLARLGDYTAAFQHGQQALQLASAAGSTAEARRVEVNCLRLLGDACKWQGDYAAAQRYFSQALEAAGQSGDWAGQQTVVNNLGIVCGEQGDYAGARHYFSQALSLARQLGDRLGEQYAHTNLGVVCGTLGDYPGAQEYYRQALQMAHETQDRWGQQYLLICRGEVLNATADYAAAQRDFEQALSIGREIGDPRADAYALFGLGSALTGLGRFEQAEQVSRQALHVRHELGHPALEAEARAALARLALAQGDLPGAAVEVNEILAYLQAGGSLDGADAPLRIYLTCAETLQETGDEQRAAQIFQTAYTLLQQRAARISDEDARRLFMEAVPWHCHIVAHILQA